MEFMKVYENWLNSPALNEAEKAAAPWVWVFTV